MKNNYIIKLLASFPVILIMLYFIPFLGICLILLRYFVCNNQKRKRIPIILILSGFIVLIPKLLYSGLNLIKIDVTIPFLNDIMDSNVYNIELIKYSKFLITLGVIFLILSFLFQKLFSKLSNEVKNYVIKEEKKDREISQKNDLLMKEKREKAQNTHVIYCPYCGADNIISEKTGTCKFCRRKIENKEK